MKRSKGFTIIELLTVIAIIGILYAVVRPMLSASASRTREFACESNLRQISVTMRTYIDDYGAFPARLQNLDGVIGDAEVLRCPKTARDYHYFAPAKEPASDDIILSCIDPKSAASWPHNGGSACLGLTAGGSVHKLNRPSHR